MTLTVGTASGNKDATEIWIGAAPGNKKVQEGWIGTAAGNKQFYTAVPPMSAIASTSGWVANPLDFNGDGIPDSFIYSVDFSVAVSGGQAPYSYAWTVNGDPYGGNSDTITVINGNSFPISANCTVTDSLGTVAVSNTVNA